MHNVEIVGHTIAHMPYKNPPKKELQILVWVTCKTIVANPSRTRPNQHLKVEFKSRRIAQEYTFPTFQVLIHSYAKFNANLD